MDLRDYIRLITRSWALIVGLVVLGAAIGGITAAVHQPVYRSTAKAFVSTPAGQSLADLSAGAGFLQVALAGYADIATTAYVLRPVIQQERLGTTPAELARRVQVTAAEQEATLQITVEDPDPTRAARTANAVVSQLSQAVIDLTPAGTSGTARGVVQLTSVDPALPATSPVGPGLLLDLLLGALAGLVLGVLLALLRELLDTRIRDRDDLERVTDAPLLGSTTRSARVREHPLTLLDAEHSPQAEEYRSIRTNLRFVRLDSANPVIVVTSAEEREGKSTTAANLALAVARLGERVLLVDADLRRPKLAAVFGLDGTIGLSDVVIGDVDADRAVQHVAAGPLDVLPSGAVPPNPNELLQSRAMDELLEQLRGRYDLIVLDSPPLLAVSDAVVLSTRAGGAVLVTAAGRSTRTRLRQALDVLERAEVRVLGTVLTMVPGRSTATYGYGIQPSAAEPLATTASGPDAPVETPVLEPVVAARPAAVVAEPVRTSSGDAVREPVRPAADGGHSVEDGRA